MATIIRGFKSIFNLFTGQKFDKNSYQYYSEDHRIHSQLEAHNIYFSEEREAHKHISSLKFMV